MSDEFLSQLEQRTQQVKITLANLEAEKIRIEADDRAAAADRAALRRAVDAERKISEANITLEGDAGSAPASDGRFDAATNHRRSDGRRPPAGGVWQHRLER